MMIWSTQKSAFFIDLALVVVHGSGNKGFSGHVIVVSGATPKKKKPPFRRPPPPQARLLLLLCCLHAHLKCNKEDIFFSRPHDLLCLFLACQQPFMALKIVHFLMNFFGHHHRNHVPCACFDAKGNLTSLMIFPQEKCWQIDFLVAKTSSQATAESFQAI